MAAIRGADTKPELRLRRALHASGFRYRLHARDVPGRPDLLLPRYRAAIFVHGCFWHRHPGCRYTTTPSTRGDFWKAKFDENVRRDARVVAELAGAGWRVAVVWECGLRGDRIKCTLPPLIGWLNGADPGPKNFPAMGREAPGHAPPSANEPRRIGSMLSWYIAMRDRQARLEDVAVPSIRDVTDPIRDHLAARLASIAEEGDLVVIFVVEDDRSLSIRLRGEPLLVNQARDVLGEEEEIGPLLS